MEKVLPWHTLSSETVLQELKTSIEGLDQAEVSIRTKKFGMNTLQIKASENVLWIFLRQFHNPLIYLLLASTGLALCLGKTIDAFVVFCVIILNTLIGFIQEYRSSKTIEALLRMIPQKSSAIRNKHLCSIPSEALIPGDIIVLTAGDRIAADIRLLSVKNLECDESALTGESIPLFKSTHPVAESTLLGERKCMAYNGTLVTSGTATGVVVATGLNTEFGKISALLEQIPPQTTPLMLTLNKIAGRITALILLMGGVLFWIGYQRGSSLLDSGIASIALAVAAIPEGLPAAITIAAAIGVERMARKKAIIRHLLAVETLGSTTIICTDKTGTLTENKMSVKSMWTLHASQEEEVEMLTAALLCNDASIEHGDPIELALILKGRERGLHEDRVRKEWPRIDVIPFEAERRIMATLHTSHSTQKIIFLKGAPEKVMHLCAASQEVHEQVENMARQGFRVLAFAKKETLFNHLSLNEGDVQPPFILLGFMGMIDPPRKEVPQAIKACQEAGITVKMITGDHPLTAEAIGRELGLLGTTKALTGLEINKLSQKQLEEVVSCHHVFARILPEDKLKIIEACQAIGHIVAMTGDGINDAPALKKANIGISMGITGTAVAKEAADIVLMDDNFASIEAAVEEGRHVYDNLIKVIIFMFPTNFAQALVILSAVLFFPINNKILLLPILPIQILWINLVVAIALTLPLAFETIEPNIMKRPPRNLNEPLLSTFVILRTILVALLMASGTILLFFWEYSQGTLREAQTLAVTTLMFFQIFYLLNCRSLRFSVFKIGFFSNPYVLAGIGFVLLIQVAFVYLPLMNTVFGSSPLNGRAWLNSMLVGLSILPIIALEKWIKGTKGM